MAEFVMKKLVREAGLSDQFLIESAATSTEEIGNGVHPGTRRILSGLGISCSGKTARRMTSGDYRHYDMLIGMDQYNIRNMQLIAGGDPEGKICRLLDLTDRASDVADPWYTGDFQTTYTDVLAGCKALLDYCKKGLPE